MRFVGCDSLPRGKVSQPTATNHRIEVNDCFVGGGGLSAIGQEPPASRQHLLSAELLATIQTALSSLIVASLRAD